MDSCLAMLTCSIKTRSINSGSVFYICLQKNYTYRTITTHFDERCCFFTPPPFELPKGQLNSEWIYEVIVSPKKPTKNFQISVQPSQDKNLEIFLLRNDDLINSLWIQQTFSEIALISQTIMSILSLAAGGGITRIIEC